MLENLVWILYVFGSVTFGSGNLHTTEVHEVGQFANKQACIGGMQALINAERPQLHEVTPSTQSGNNPATRVVLYCVPKIAGPV